MNNEFFERVMSALILMETYVIGGLRQKGKEKYLKQLNSIMIQINRIIDAINKY